ncbi:hypothetical protein CLM65_11135 [Serratia marcescens]|uniref:hypothetical protein n=1 Tax=Serratia marcescens TaxID=615 RepID=UPI000A1734F6|nr:hypothetical protein [Serratia marcescens]AWC73606.1 hypothetical protein AM371_01010 [Serratia marcescens]AXH02049.1 phage protein inside capsid D [Serratia marcescens]AXH02724.1 phage protein inside capsid D [Serratia marcescens]EIJ6702006.1 hypothetical protein [Serratia marcescens]EIV5186766.1 hypothetical protein [Serratia marcescens]
MPTYEMKPDDLLSADVQSIPQPDDSSAYMETPSLLSAFNPFTDNQQVQRGRDAAFRIDNSLGSFIATAPFSQFDKVDGYNPFDNDAADLKGYEDYADSFIDAGSPDETRAIKQRIDQQIQDRQYLSETGGAGTISSLAMGLIDPINLASMFVPAGAVVRGGEVAATAGRFALANAIGGIASEAALSATQETRTLDESAANVAVDAMIGGILGAGAQLLAGAGQRTAVSQAVASNLRGNDSPQSIGAAQVFNTTLDQEQLAGVGLINKTLSVNPGGRLAQSPSRASRAINQQLAENNYFFAKNDEGLATFTAAETKIKQYDAMLYKQMESTKDAYQAYSKNIRAAGGKRMNFVDFNEAVGMAMRRGDQSDIPEVAQAAAQIRPMFEATKVRMQELGILPEDVDVSTAQSYLPRIYKFDKILSDRTEFRGRIANWIQGISAKGADAAGARIEKIDSGLSAAAEAEPRAKALADEIAAAESWSGRKTELMDEVGNRTKLIGQEQDLTARLEKQQAQLATAKNQKLITRLNKEVSDLRTKLDDVARAKEELPTLQRHLELLDNPRKHRSELRKLQKKANSTTRLNASRERALKAMEPLSREEAEDAADEIVNKIIGAPSGLVPAQLLPEKIIGRAGFTKSRSLLIPDERIEDFLESDINHVMESYLRQVGPEIELTAQFGSKDMGEQIRQVSEEYTKLIKDAKTPKERAKLEKQREADLRDIEAMRDRLIGTYGAPKDPRSFFVRAGRVARNVNFLRLLGGMTISAATDLMRPVMQHGLSKSLRPMGAMLGNMAAVKVATKDLREMAVGLDYVLSTRTKAIADLTDPYSRRSAFERGLNWGTQKFGNWTLMNQWNTALKSWSGLIVQSRILDNAQLLAAGKEVPQKEVRKLAQIGIDQSMLRRIGEQFAKHGEDMDGLLTGHSHLWDDRAVREAFQSAVLKDVDSTVVTPGVGDTPLMMSNEVGKMILQFKTFIFAQHNRVIASGIQQGDASFYLGAMGTIALGAMVYVMKQKLSGRDIDYSPNNLVKEGIDRAGMIGWLSEPLNAVENISGGRFGLGAMFGAPPVSRFQSRNAIGALMGPTFDMAGDGAVIANGVLNGEFDDKQTHAVRKLLPYQNLFYISPLLNRVEEQLK